MAKGKQTCKILKEIRKQIAAENDIEFVTSECTYKGDCKGTCPKCEAEVRYLERELEKRQRMGKAAIFAGMSLGTLFAATSCDHPIPQPTEGEPCVPDSTEMQNPVDTVSNDTLMLEGDVLAPVPDSLEKGKKFGCISVVKEGLEIVGGIEDESFVNGQKEEDNQDSIAMYEPMATEGIIELEPYDEGGRWGKDVFQIVEQMPEFPGGEEAIREFVAKNIQYPQKAKDAGAYGRVFVGFVIEPDGSVSNVTLLRGIGFDCDEEAMRVVKTMPKWKPGMQRGKAVRVSYLLPIDFKLEND